MRVRLLGGGAGNLLPSGLTVGLPPNIRIQFGLGYDGNGTPGFYADVPPSVGLALLNSLSALPVGGDARTLDARLSTTNQFPQVTPAVAVNPTPPPFAGPFFTLDQSKLGGPDVLA